jgi:hypothetical protein
MEVKGTDRGASLIAYDKVNDVLVFQWRDNRVVNCVSTLVDVTMEATQRREGQRILQLTVPAPLKEYHRWMFGADKGDQRRMHMGGFARKAHFKKWYKKSFFAVLDVMLLNSLIAWNLSVCEDPTLQRCHLERYEFYAWIAQDFLNFKDTTFETTKEKAEQATAGTHDKPAECFIVVPPKSNRRCTVCNLDAIMSHKYKGVRCRVFYCETCLAFVHEHEPQGDDRRPIHDMFPSMTCHDIMRSTDGKELWKKAPGGKCTVRTSHPVWRELRSKHGKQPSKKKRKT